MAAPVSLQWEADPLVGYIATAPVGTFAYSECRFLFLVGVKTEDLPCPLTQADGALSGSLLGILV